MGTEQQLCSYCKAHWDTLGCGNFISVAVGLNVAILSWQQFQSTLQSAQKRLEAKIASKKATMSEYNTGHFNDLVMIVMSPLLWVSKWVWSVAFLLSFLAAISGILMLYINKNCPFDFLLLLPLALYFSWSWIALWILTFWILIVRRGMKFFGEQISIPDLKKEEKSIPDFTVQIGKEIDP